MKNLLLAIASLLCSAFIANARNDENLLNPYTRYFDDAYLEHPNLPKGVLEAVAFCNTRFSHLTNYEAESCIGIPKAYTVMGLTLDGKNYFKNNLQYVSSLSGISVNEMLQSPQKSILAYAKALSVLLEINKNTVSKNYQLTVNDLADALVTLSELPHENANQYFAVYTQLYGFLSFMTDLKNQEIYNFPNPDYDLPAYFGSNYAILSAKHITLSEKEIKDENGNTFKIENPINSIQTVDYPPALWVAANSNNFSTYRGASVSAVTIHFVQGSYSSCISWFQNPSAGVSAHYVLRSSDGQVTQMVLEAHRAFHVGTENPYTVGLEHEGYVSQQSWYTQAMYQSSAALTADICADYGINPLRTGFYPWLPTTYYNQSSIPGSCTKVKGHMHYPNQTNTDPGPYWDWNKYYMLINTPPAATVYTSASGNFYDSGGSSGNYSDDERIVWQIAPTNATQVTITFNSFSTENTWDYLYIYDGSSVNAPLIGYYTGTNSPGTITSSGGELTVEFRSDCATTSAGWNASWTSNTSNNVPTNLSVSSNACPQIGVTLSWQNQGAGWFVDVSDNPNFTTFYNKSVANATSVGCPGSFELYPSQGVYLQFIPNTTYYWRVWDGTNLYAGNSFTTPVCATTNTNCTGNIYDTGGPSNPHSGNEDYTYTIQPTNAQNVTINFSAFDLEAGYDSLYIHDGSTINAPLIGGYTGTNSPGNITSSGGAITLHFVSDPFVNNAGFSATWQCSLLSSLGSYNTTTDFSVFPNPTSGITTIVSSKKINSIQVINALGEVVLTQAVNATDNTLIDLSNLPAAIYLIKADVSGIEVVRIITKQ
jgi:N-acetyl-anhydromuramyl-L-alanine amidase AmpD